MTHPCYARNISGAQRSPLHQNLTEMQLSEGGNALELDAPPPGCEVGLGCSDCSQTPHPKVAKLKMKGEAAVDCSQTPYPKVAKLKGEAAVTAVGPPPPRRTAVSGDPPTLHDGNFPILNIDNNS